MAQAQLTAFLKICQEAKGRPSIFSLKLFYSVSEVFQKPGHLETPLNGAIVRTMFCFAFHGLLQWIGDVLSVPILKYMAPDLCPF